MSESRVPPIVRYGCVGCVGVVALAVVGIAITGVIAVAASRIDADVVAQQLEQPLPGSEEPGVVAAAADLEALAADVDAPTSLAVRASEPSGRIVIDLSTGRFTLAAGRPGEPLRVDAEYDQARYELERRFDEGPEGWTTTIRFGPKGGLLRLIGHNDNDGSLRITVPPDVPFALAGEVALGESELNLTGLAIEELDLALRLGDHELFWDGPAGTTMRSFAVRSAMGEVSLSGLGWASPESVELNHKMGELEVDLEGEWRNDAEIRARFKMGPCTVHVPRGVQVVVDQASVNMGETRIDPERREAPEGAPTLSLDLSGRMGELVVRR